MTGVRGQLLAHGAADISKTRLSVGTDAGLANDDVAENDVGESLAS